MPDPDQLVYFTRADVAAFVGVSKQAIVARYIRGSMPEPDAYLADGSPLWLPATVEGAVVPWQKGVR